MCLVEGVSWDPKGLNSLEEFLEGERAQLVEGLVGCDLGSAHP